MAPLPAQTAITKHQIKMIHTLKSALSIHEETYRGSLLDAYGVYSSKDLTYSQAESVLRYFEKEAIELGVWQQRSGEDKHKSLKGRTGYASPAQLSFIEGLWAKVSRAETPADRERALRSFLMRQAKVTDLRFLTSSAASKVICALKGMRNQKSGKGC